jgi:quinol monooxygenase YgiN
MNTIFKIFGVVMISVMLLSMLSFSENQKTEKISIMAIMHPKKGKEKDLLNALTVLVKPTHSEEGCISYNVHKTKDNVIFLYEVWRSQEDLEKHLKMPYIIDFVDKLNDFLDGENEVHFGKLISKEKKLASIGLINDSEVHISSIKVPKKGKSTDLKNELLSLVKPTHAEEGCVVYNLYEEKDGSLFLYEVWRSQKDLDVHFQKKYIADFRKKVVGLAERNDINFGKIIKQ